METVEQERIENLQQAAKNIDSGVTLDAEAPQKVSYCIPIWMRDAQIKHSLTRTNKRLTPPYPVITEKIACVSFGPSLNDTWEEIKKFQFIITCSGAHKFLVDRGIIPTWHLDVDPRPHKVALIGTPQKQTKYLIASACCKDMWDHLEGYDTTLWHIFDGSDDGWRQLPAGEWAVTGGCSAGLRTLTMARLLGFTNLHIFGMDGSDSERHGKHAAAHPNQAKGRCEVKFPNQPGPEQRTFYTTPAFLEAARQTWHELDVMPDVTFKFYGDGLVQHMSKFYIRKQLHPKQTGNLAYSKAETITPYYAEQNRLLHEANMLYGVGGAKHVETIKDLYQLIHKTQEFVSVLDYGCGKGRLAAELPFPIFEYDPAIPGKTESPKAADLVVCTDVLEHIEPDCLKAVLMDLRRCVKQLGFFTIHTGPASKTLPDGRNTHLIQQSIEWWEAQLRKVFFVGKIFVTGPELTVVVMSQEYVKASKAAGVIQKAG